MDRCVFCGEAPVTLEHLWGSWIAAALYVSSKKRKKARRTTPVTPHVSEGDLPSEFRREWKMPSLSQAARISCGRCNHGWIAEFDEKAKPILTPMMRGERVTLSETDQRLVARWFAKTAMVFMYTSASTRRPIPMNQYRYLRDHYRPPPSTQIWIGARSAEDGVMTAAVSSCFLRNDPSATEESCRAYLVAFGIGHLAAVLFGHNVPFEMPWASLAGLEEIWPNASAPVEWPPHFVIGPIQPLADDSRLEAHLIDSSAKRGITFQRMQRPT